MSNIVERINYEEINRNNKKVDELGRVVIPKEIRENLNIQRGARIEIYVDKNSIILEKFKDTYCPECSTRCEYTDKFCKKC